MQKKDHTAESVISKISRLSAQNTSAKKDSETSPSLSGLLRGYMFSFAIGRPAPQGFGLSDQPIA